MREILTTACLKTRYQNHSYKRGQDYGDSLAVGLDPIPIQELNE